MRQPGQRGSTSGTSGMSGTSGTSGTSTLTRYDPFAEFNRLTRQLTQLVEDRWPDMPSLIGRDGFSPPADVEETDDAYLIELDLPGVDKEDIDVETSGRRLVVKGERKEKQRSGMLRWQTRTVGRFRYEVVLPTRSTAATSRPP